MTELYRDYKISYDPPPVPTRAWDYQFAHVDYDGPGDNRCGTATSLEDAKRQIDEIIANGECKTCGGSGVIETELHEGLVNCPACHVIGVVQ